MAAGNETKAQLLEKAVRKAVGAGDPVAMETVDFSDPNRPLTCLEVDFPIIPVNQVAIIEGNAGKPIYQVSKWWARRRSSVFRSLLIAAATKAPDDPLEASKKVWDSYYKNHQKMGAFAKLKVVDPFMGGGTTIVEGSRLGMQMTGVDLNPVAWFVVKTELAKVDKAEVEALLADVEREVKPRIMPFYAIDCPRGHKGTWTRAADGAEMGEGFDPLVLSPEQRAQYAYKGPEIIYVFWAKHGPCQVTGCGHRTPILSSPVMAVKTLTVKAWGHTCRNEGCGRAFEIEEADARMAPGVPLVVAETEDPYAVYENAGPTVRGQRRVDVTCPSCGEMNAGVQLTDKHGKRKKIELSLLVSRTWLRGARGVDDNGSPLGGTTTSSADATAAWNNLRASAADLFEVRGKLPEAVVCPISGQTLRTGKEGGTVTGPGTFACGACGKHQRLVEAVGATSATAPVASFSVQGHCHCCDADGVPYGGRFFANARQANLMNATEREWERRREGDLAKYWPRSAIPFGHMTHQRQPLPQHGYLRWVDMFNARQLLVLGQLLRAVSSTGTHRAEVREFVMSAFQQYVRNQNMFCFWDISRDGLAPSLSNANFHPKSTVIENSAFATLGRGNWQSCAASLFESLEWSQRPWEVVGNAHLVATHPRLAEVVTGASEKTSPGDPPGDATLINGSATDIEAFRPDSVDLVITDPPFGGLLHYSELSDFFYVWLRLILKDRYPDIFTSEYVPKSLEIVENRARHPDDAESFYQRLLTAAWSESHRILKPGGILAFTFHHSEDEPWVAVLESLFDAGFYLEATYPIRSDETKGEGEFGSKTVEYDIIHVCRKRTADPEPVSWAKMRREILKEVQRLQSLLEHHQRDGLPAADIQVIKRGKALEYYSKHYGQVYESEGAPMSVKEAVLGVLQVLDEETAASGEAPPGIASPYTRQMLRMFLTTSTLARDQVQKYLRGTGIAPSEFEERGWVMEEKKVYNLRPFLEIAHAWHRKHKAGIQNDYDQAAILIGACMEGSGINAEATLSNSSFKPHPALPALLEWFATKGVDSKLRVAAARAQRLYNAWVASQKPAGKSQLALFGAGEESA